MTPPKRLYLLRHAKSSWDDPALSDFERPLAPRGLEACERLSRYLEREQVRPVLVLCSPARRARETLERIARALGQPAIDFDDSLYTASETELLARLRRLPERLASVMVVGHNPGLQHLAVHLGGTSAAELDESFPTGALATFTHDRTWRELASGAAMLTACVVPRELD